jgi:hypothetical protein
VIWEASDWVCGKRLRPLMPVLVEAMERHGHLQLVADVRTGLLAIARRPLTGRCAISEGSRKATKPRGAFCAPAQRDGADIRRLGRSAAWVHGSGSGGAQRADGAGGLGADAEVTDIATGWTECAPVLVREQVLLTEVLGEIRKLLPFPLLGFDTDNDSVFMNETVRDYCQSAGIAFTRCRPYRKNDQAWVEQKNGAVVRRTVGYRRFEGLDAALARLYAALRLFVSFFQPSFKLAGKARDGARVKKRYHAPATPYQRLLADPRTPEEVRRRVDAVYASLDPVR